MPPGLPKPRRGGVDETLEWLCILGHTRELLVAVLLPRLGPFAPALLDNPQANDVLEETNRIAVADFVGEIVLQALLRDDRLGAFDAQHDQVPELR